MAMALDTLLETDHQRIRQVLSDLQSLSDDPTSTRSAGMNELVRQLVPHLKAEESVLYSTLDDGSSVMELQNDHGEMIDLLGELERLGQDAPQWLTKFSHLAQLIEDHFVEEERVAFPKVRPLLDEDVLWKPSALVLEVKRRTLARLS